MKLFTIIFFSLCLGVTEAKTTNHSPDNLGNLTLNFTYSGDVSGVPRALSQYDNRLKILRPSGKPGVAQIVNLQLQQVKVQDIIDAINVQTNGQVNLVYNSSDDSVRLNYAIGLDVGKDAVSESLKWQNGGNPKPILLQDGVVRFPYGAYQPVVVCEPLNLCDIELQPGETIQGIVIGDSLRWNEGDQSIPVVYSGTQGNLVPHLVLKPSQGGLDTSLMVTTSRHTYMIHLKSANNGYVARAGFYYPAEMVQDFENNKSLLRGNTSANNASATITDSTNPDLKLPLIDLKKANYNYSMSRGNYAWRPTQVFDDGTSVYIQMPDGVSSRDLPGLCVVLNNNDSQCEMVNFRYNDHFYIVDKLFDQAKLINGFDNSAQIITITRNPAKGFWARLFGG